MAWQKAKHSFASVTGNPEVYTQAGNQIALVVRGRRDAQLPRSLVGGHVVSEGAACAPISSNPVSGQCDKRTLLEHYVSVEKVTLRAVYNSYRFGRKSAQSGVK